MSHQNLHEPHLVNENSFASELGEIYKLANWLTSAWYLSNQLV